MFSLSKLSPSITDMIRMDHSHVLLSFHQYTADARPRVKKALTETICTALEIHATLEEECFYPAMRLLDGADPVIQKSVPEHDDMRRLIAELRASEAIDARHDQLLMELMQKVIHHVADEETVLLPQAERRLGKDQLSEMGARMTSRRLQLAGPRAGSIAANTAVGFSGSTTALVLAAVGGLVAVRYLSRQPERVQA
jgi:hemerythrin superfamily protein